MCGVQRIHSHQVSHIKEWTLSSSTTVLCLFTSPLSSQLRLSMANTNNRHSSSKCKIAIVGAGVIGLSTALAVTEQLPDAQITIFADKILTETTSIGAAGIFRPEAVASPGCDESTFKVWAEKSYSYFASLANSQIASIAGVQVISGFILSTESPNACKTDLMESIVPYSSRDVTSSELDTFANAKYNFGRFYTTLLVDPRYYLKWMLSILLKTCNLVMRRIESLDSDEMLESFDVIVNCTGLGARDIVPDHNVAPIRGQTIKVPAPWIKHFVYADSVYVIPASDGMVTLGGIYQFNISKSAVDADDRNWIWQKCTELFPSLKEIDEKDRLDWVGLRPFRGTVRVEAEVRPGSGRKIVHNYGHGGHGIALSRGTAVHAASLVKQLLLAHKAIHKARL